MNNQLVTRFAQYGAGMLEWPDGDYVKYDDYAALEVEQQGRRKADKPPVHPTIADKQLDDETLRDLIDFRRTTFEYHSKEGHEVQTVIHGVTLSALVELQEHRKAEAADREMLKRLTIIMSGSDTPGEIRSLTVTAQSLVDHCKQLVRTCEQVSARLE